MSKVKTVRVTQIGSHIRRPKDQLQTLIGLGLGKLHRSRQLKATPEVMGMLAKVQHMIRIEDVKE